MVKIDRHGIFGVNIDILAIQGPIADTDISKIFKFCFLLHYQKYDVFYTCILHLSFFWKTSKFYEPKFFKFQQFQYFPMILVVSVLTLLTLTSPWASNFTTLHKFHKLFGWPVQSEVSGSTKILKWGTGRMLSRPLWHHGHVCVFDGRPLMSSEKGQMIIQVHRIPGNLWRRRSSVHQIAGLM